MQLTKNLTRNPLDLAKESNDTKILEQLAHNVDATIRRAVARNINTPSGILSQLANDPVLNVSYMASSNPKCSEKREFSDTSNPCISCEKDERTMVCVNCSTLNAYYNR